MRIASGLMTYAVFFWWSMALVAMPPVKLRPQQRLMLSASILIQQ